MTDVERFRREGYAQALEDLANYFDCDCTGNAEGTGWEHNYNCKRCAVGKFKDMLVNYELVERHGGKYGWELRDEPFLPGNPEWDDGSWE